MAYRTQPLLNSLMESPPDSASFLHGLSCDATFLSLRQHMDADAILEKDALLRVMVPTLANPDQMIASVGIVRIVNGTTVENGAVAHVRLRRSLLEILQVIEYLRSFLIGRRGWAQFNLLTIVSGAVGIFHADMCRKIGGFRRSAIGEDMDLVVRMHRSAREKGDSNRVAFVPDPVCWTEAPSTLRSLASQRARWQNGLTDILWRNPDMVFKWRYRRIGFIALPYQWIFAFIAPLLEVFGWGTILSASILGALSPAFFLEFLLFGYLFGTMISSVSVVIEEMSYHRRNNPRDLMRLIGVCFLEYFPYRPLNSLWRVRGIWGFLTGRNSWCMIDRVGFAANPQPGDNRIL